MKFRLIIGYSPTLLYKTCMEHRTKLPRVTVSHFRDIFCLDFFEAKKTQEWTRENIHYALKCIQVYMIRHQPVMLVDFRGFFSPIFHGKSPRTLDPLRSHMAAFWYNLTHVSWFSSRFVVTVSWSRDLSSRHGPTRSANFVDEVIWRFYARPI